MQVPAFIKSAAAYLKPAAIFAAQLGLSIYRRFFPERQGESPRGISPTIFKYVLAETFFAFLICFLFFFAIFFVNQLLLMAQDILSKHVPLGQVALLVLYAIPSVIAMSAPFASLVAMLMTVGRLTSDNEILVLLSAGLSYRNVFLPAITAGIIISMVSFFSNDVLMPAGQMQFSKLYRRILVATPALELEANSVKKFKDTIIVTGDVSGNAINNVLILDRTSDGERRLIMANSAELKDGGKQGLALDMEGAFVQSVKELARDDYDYASADLLQYWVPRDDIMQQVSSVTPKEMTSRDVWKEIKKKKIDLGNRLNDRQNKIVFHGLNLEESLRRGSQAEAWNRRANLSQNYLREVQVFHETQNDRNLSIYVIEFYKKFSMPLGAFSFVFLSVSIGLMAKRSGQTVGFIVGMMISVVYWTLLVGGQAMGVRLSAPPFWAMWLPNILALSIGGVLTVMKVRR